MAFTKATRLLRKPGAATIPIRHTRASDEESSSGTALDRGLLTEADVADSKHLRDTHEVGDRDTNDPVDCFDAVDLERIHNAVKRALFALVAASLPGRGMLRIDYIVCV